jgi:hypothetical protein
MTSSLRPTVAAGMYRWAPGRAPGVTWRECRRRWLMMTASRNPSRSRAATADGGDADRPGTNEPDGPDRSGVSRRKSPRRAGVLLGGIRPYERSWLSRDIVAGVTLAALAIDAARAGQRAQGTRDRVRDRRSRSRRTQRTQALRCNRPDRRGSSVRPPLRCAHCVPWGAGVVTLWLSSSRQRICALARMARGIVGSYVVSQTATY